jgi:uncharacterized membrane protein YdjX (TVP38/TMEM64 family)
MRIVIALLWLGLVATLILSGVASNFTVDGTVEMVRRAGVWGVIAFIAIFAFLQPLCLSGHILIFAAALVFDSHLAILFSLIGALGASSSCFLVARYLAFDWIQRRLPLRLKKYERWVVDRGVWGVIGFRILTFTFPPAMMMMGTLRVRFSTMVVGTAIGFLPQICVDVLLGGEILRYLLGALGF